MKKLNFLCAIALLIFATVSCSKKDEKKDNIIFENIQQFINMPNNVIKDFDKKYLFKLIHTNNNSYSAIFTIKNSMIIGDAYASVIVKENTNTVMPLEKGFVVSESSNWLSIKDLNLECFAGKGEKFIGYQLCTYPQGEKDYNYGWIKIKLSVNKDTLWIINRATNNTQNKSILTGQK